MNTQHKKAWINLHIAVFLFGITAILGDLIELSALVLVWWRVLITSLSLLLFVNPVKLVKQLSLKMLLSFVGIGVIVALHWLTFYAAIKVSNASITLVCMATTSFMTAILEPIILKRKFQLYELLIGAIIIPAMALIVSSVETTMMMGFVYGLLSAFLAALFSILNKKWVDETNPMNITFVELSSAWLFLSLLLPFIFIEYPSTQFMPQGLDWLYISILALLCTTLAYVLALKALKYISAFASNLTINLEPVYGIVLAALLLNDASELSPPFYLGGLIILVSVFSFPFVQKRWGRQ